jgi:cyclopropane fatty-acyl-phospholipid synthase-like methyltransferase
MPKTKTKRQKKPALTARTADKHILYQESVQDTETEAGFLLRTFQKMKGRPALTLREDFCGTALLCAEWVKKKERTAVGIDLDAAVLAWGTKHNLEPIGEPGNRVTLRQANVLDKCPGRFDITVALNFSYFIFRTREVMRDYFKAVRTSVAKDGVFVLDAYGGYESWRQMEEPRNMGRFTYVWDQDEVDPIDNGVVNYIHFEFKDGTKLRKAFTYEWRLWTLPELTELLAEAGFSRSTIYWEGADAKGEGNGIFHPKTHVAQEAAWVAYIIAEP